jgi:hypothetical protein
VISRQRLPVLWNQLFVSRAALPRNQAIDFCQGPIGGPKPDTSGRTWIGFYEDRCDGVETIGARQLRAGL